MNFRSWILAGAIAGAVLGSASTSSAQGYQSPAGPTMTPYLDYFNAPTTPFASTYYQYARPRAQLQSNLNQLGATVNRQGYELGQVRKDMLQIREAEAGATGSVSTYMNYSHYYSGTQGHASRRSGGGGGRR